MPCFNDIQSQICPKPCLRLSKAQPPQVSRFGTENNANRGKDLVREAYPMRKGCMIVLIEHMSYDRCVGSKRVRSTSWQKTTDTLHEYEKIHQSSNDLLNTTYITRFPFPVSTFPPPSSLLQPIPEDPVTLKVLSHT